MLTALNSNVTLAELDAYHADRLTPGWAVLPQATREAAAVRATDYIDFSYTFYADVIFPNDQVKRATCALAALATESTLTEAATADVLIESGSGIGSITYGKRGSDPYPAVTAMLRGVATRNGAAMVAARALI